MKCSINQKIFSNALNIVQKAISVRTTMHILTGILIEVEDNKMYLTATDLELGIKTTVECNSLENGSIVVNSKIIGDFIKKLPLNSLIEITTDEKNKMELKCLNSDFNLLCNSAEEYPANTFENEGIEIETTAEILKNLIKFTNFATAQDNLKPVLSGCLMQIKNNICTFAAIDGYRLAVKKEKIICEELINIIIPSKTLSEIYRIIENTDENIKLIISNSHILFKLKNILIISNLLEGEFIKYEDIINEGYETKIKIESINLKNSIERISLLSRDDKNNLVIFEIKEKNLVINSTSEYGNGEEKINIIKDGQDLRIGFNSKYIYDLLKIIENETIYMEFQGKLNPCIIKNNEKNNKESDFIYLILPVRIS